MKNSIVERKNIFKKAQYLVFHTCKMGELTHSEASKDLSKGTEVLIEYLNNFTEKEIDIYDYIDNLEFNDGEKTLGT